MNHTFTLSIATALLVSMPLCAEETLEPITVTSTNKTEQSIKETTSGVTVIRADEIEERGFLSIAEAINTVAGISVAQSGGLGQQSSFFLRGADSGKVLVLLDGMRLNDPSTPNGTAMLESLTTENIAQIEIIKGGMSSIWGSNASAGIINIITKTPQKGIHGSLSLLYGSNETYGLDGDIAYQDEKLSAQILASTLDTEGISALAPAEAELDGYNNKTMNVKLGYRFDEKNTLQLSYNRVAADTAYDVGFADDTESMIDSKQENMALSYLFSLENYSAKLHASKGKYHREASDSYGGFSRYESDIEEYGFINTLNHAKGKLVGGIEYKGIQGDNQYESTWGDTVSKAAYKNRAIFVSNLFHITSDTLLETNLRYDGYDNFENKTTYKIGLKHHHSTLEGLTTAANYYTSYDAPSAYQLAEAQIGLELIPSYTKGYEITASYKKLLSIAYFDNRVEDTIGYIYDPLTYSGSYQNIDGKEKYKGIEVTSSYALPVDGLIVSANYTRLFDYEKTDNTNYIRRPDEVLNGTLDYYFSETMIVGIAAHYIGDREDAYFDPATYAAIPTTTGNYTLWNLNFSKELTKSMKLTLNAKNIFDKAYQSVYGYATEGRSAYARVTYSF